ncbi:disulfide isomerase [Acrasis kona]|uniref:Disulfide isomerase n=1 Tax=Acrasis kona TaxID=1008807 RepID=A0AAW2YU21_9EUKA
MRTFGGLIILCLTIYSYAQYINIDYKNYDQITNDNEYVLVQFVPKRCQDCERHKNIFKMALDILDTKIPVGVVNCSSRTEEYICLKNKVADNQIPPIMLFHNINHAPYRYEGEDSPKQIKDWVTRKTKINLVAVHSLDEIQKLRQEYNSKNTTLVVGFFEKYDTIRYRWFTEYSHRPELQHLMFAECVKCPKNALEAFNITLDMVASLKYDNTFQRYADFQNLPQLLSIYASAPFEELNDATSSRFHSSQIPVMVFYTDLSDVWEDEDQLNAFNSVKDMAPAFVGRITFMYAEFSKYRLHFERAGIAPIPLPKIILFAENGGHIYSFNTTGKEMLGDWLNKFMRGQLVPYLKSEEAPLDNSGPVQKLVTSTFKSTVMEGDKDVVVLFVIPNSVDCEAFEPVYNKLAASLSSVEMLSFTKIDVTKNNIPKIYLPVYPCIYVFPADNKSNPVRFEGDKSESNIKKFLNSNCKVSRSHQTEKRKRQRETEKKDEL